MLETQGSLFEATEEVLCHGVNVYGVMGAGIAKEFRARFPENYVAYRLTCLDGRLIPGDIFATYDYDNELQRQRFIINIASQVAPGRNATYALLEAGLEKAVSRCIVNDYSTAAINKIGCGIGGLKWDRVAEYIKDSERDGFEWNVYYN